MVDVRRLVQLALDLWDRSEPEAPPAVAAPAPVVAPEVVPHLEKKPVLAPDQSAPAVPVLGVAAPSSYILLPFSSKM